ncbi:MAG: MBOAT family protein [Lachnospiraceae bacterium]|nr:MBOAT family protein [Lachnospiraceae bacterium]
MLFNSAAFAIFLPIVFLVYWAVPNKYRYIILAISGYWFYMSWNAKYVVLILFTTGVSYLAARIMETLDQSRTGARKACMFLAIVASLSVLFFFKYFNFTFATLERICKLVAIPLHPVTLSLLLPVGISFYTFQTLSYVIDVYHGEAKAERNFVKYAAFVSFFPQLVAGPIERTKNLLPQMDKEHVFTYEKGSYGLKLMAWGFFKKMVIADNLATFVDKVFAEVGEYQGFTLVLAVFFFTIQIYCDFSGYSDIAIGTAKLFDIDLMKNFDSPYFSASFREFWRRWHISLSSWFRDYVYIPLGGNRKGKVRTNVNVLVTMSLSGLWHGAAFTYIVWGGLHGLVQCLENVLFPGRKKDGTKNEAEKGSLLWWVRVFVVFLVVSSAWCFFRAGSVKEALSVFAGMPVGIRHFGSYVAEGFRPFKFRSIMELVLPFALLFAYDYRALSHDPLKDLEKLTPAVRFVLYVCFVIVMLLLASFNSQEFVYFQF